MRANRASGFTLVELMVVVAITTVLAGMAIVSWNRTAAQGAVDRWANAIKTTITAASRRAVSTQAPYMVQIMPSSVQYCQVDPTTISGTTTSQTGCAGLASTYESGPLQTPPNDAMTSYYATTADVVGPSGTYSATSKTALSTSGTVFFLGANGTVSSSFANVMTRGVIPTGFTVYTRRSSVDETPKRRRIVALGVSGRARIIDNY